MHGHTHLEREHGFLPKLFVIIVATTGTSPISTARNTVAAAPFNYAEGYASTPAEALLKLRNVTKWNYWSHETDGM